MVQSKGLAAMVKKWKDVSLFAPTAGSIRVRFKSMVYDDARIYEMSSGSLQLMPFGPALRAQGRDWPLEAVTMVGTKRLENLENCCCTVLEEGIPGDF